MLANGPARTSELRRRIGGISDKMLIQTLRRLERNGFVERRAFPEVPPRVEYSLTPLGASLSEPITTLDRWVERHLPDIDFAQRAFDERS
jgi:DNA-binding HxlR family transcriptional regulator